MSDDEVLKYYEMVSGYTAETWERVRQYSEIYNYEDSIYYYNMGKKIIRKRKLLKIKR